MQLKLQQLLVDTARRTLLQLQPQKKTRIHDDTLSRLCALSRAAWRAWNEAGQPTEGSVYEKKCDMRRQVRKRVNYCAALAERKRVQNREKQFRTGDNDRLRHLSGGNHTAQS